MTPHIVSKDTPQASWLAIGSLSVGAFALVTSEFLPVGLLSDIARDIGVTHGQAGLMVTMPGLIAAIAAPLSIIYAGQMERRKLLCFLLTCLVASDLIVALSTSFVPLLIGRALLGIGIGSFWTMAGALGPRLRAGPEGIRASALILGGVSLGTVAGLPAGSLLGELFGWRYAFATGAMLAGVAIVAVLTLLPRIAPTHATGLRDLVSILRDTRFRGRLLSAVLMVVGAFASYTYVAPFLGDTAGISGGMLSAVLLANGVAGFAGNIAGGWLASRDPRHAVMVNTAIALASVLLLVTFGTHIVLAIIFVAGWGFAFGMMPIALQSWMQSLFPDRLEALQAFYVSMTQAGLGLGALVGGVVVDQVGTSAAMLLVAGAALVTLLVAATTPSSPPALTGVVHS